MIRYASTLVVVGVAFCVASFAQPARLWKRDGHAGTPIVASVERSSGYVYVVAASTLYLWDTDGDTVVRRTVLEPREFTYWDRAEFLSDNIVLVSDDTRGFAQYSVSTGKRILSSYGYQIVWIDPSKSVYLGWSSYADTQFLLIGDARTFEVKRKVEWLNPWPLGRVQPLAYDTVRKIIYVRHLNNISAIDTLGTMTVVRDFQGSAVPVALEPLDDGTLLASFIMTELGDSRLGVLDPVTGSMRDADTLSFPGVGMPHHNKNVMHRLPNGNVLFQSNELTMHVVRLNPLVIVRSIAIPNSYVDVHVHGSDSVYLTDTDGGLHLVQLATGTVTQVLPTYSAVNSATQLNTGQLVLAQLDALPQVVSLATGDDQYPLLASEKWNRNFLSQRSMTVMAASKAPIVTLCGGQQCHTFNLSDTAWLCTQIGVGSWIDGSATDFMPVWVDSLGSGFRFQYSYEPWPHSSLVRGTAIGYTSSPCDTVYIRADGTGIGIGDKGGHPTIERVSISKDGAMTLFKALGAEAKDANGIHLAYYGDPKNPTHLKYPSSTHGVVMNSGVHGVLDDSNGLAVIDARYSEVRTQVALGQRHLPLQRMQTSEHVLTYVNNAVHCVDFVNAQILWSVPVASQPSSILVDRNDRWFLCLYPDDYIEMFALDTTVSVNEATAGTQSLHVYPNPASETLSVQAPFPMHICEVYDVLGNVVLTLRLNEASQASTLNIDKLPKGTYVLSATAGVRRATALVQKQ